MSGILETTRPQACLGASVVSLLGSHLSGSRLSDWNVWSAALVALLIVATCNIVNDLIDLRADLVDRPDRPLASGRIGKRAAAIATLVVALAGLAAAVPVGVEAVIVAAGFLLAGLAYSIFIRRVSLLGHLWVAVTFGATAVWGGWTSGGTPPPVWAAGLLVALFLLPRELLKSLGDVRGDRLAGWRTAAVVWGRAKTMRAVVAAVMVFAAATLLPFLGGIGRLSYLVAIWVGAVLPLAAVTVWLWPGIDQRLRRGEFLLGLMWFPGLAALWQLG